MPSHSLLKVVLVSLLSILFANGLVYGQVDISGQIRATDGSVVTGANIIARTEESSTVFAFAISDHEGRYTLSLSTRPKTMLLQVTHLNYEPAQKQVSAPDTVINWELLFRVYNLPEMVVKQEAVIRRGDTIVYDVNQLKQAGDESIEAILKNIPGITVARDGTISYDDLQISKFYIEGLDMLEGRYSIATRNLPISAIRDVEIIEHHQAIRALDSIVRPPNAAINLRLKSSISLTGTASGALGAQPLAHEVEASLFGFAKQQQFSLLGSGNNIGNPFASNFKDLYQADAFELPLIAASLPSSPVVVPNTNYLDNDLLSGGFNTLRKIGKYSQLKWSGYLSDDEIFRAGSNERTFLDSESSVLITQMIQSTQQDQQLNSRLNYEYNHPVFYLKSTVSGSWFRNQYAASNTINGVGTNEDLSDDNLELSARFTSIIRSEKKALRINGNYQAKDQEFDLFVTPLALVTVGQPTISTTAANQRARLRTNEANLYTTQYLKLKNLTHSAQFGIRSEATLLSSNLYDLSASTPESLGAGFRNDNRTTIHQPYVDYSLERLKKGNKWKLSFPLATHFFRHFDATSEQRNSRNVLVTKPKVEYIKRLALQRSLSFAYAFGLDYRRDDLFFSNYLLRQSRQASISTPILNRTQQHQASVRYKGRNEKGTIALGSFLEGSLTRAELLQTTVFNRQGEASILSSSNNTSSKIAWSNRVSFYGVKGVDINMKLNYNLIFLPVNVNAQNLNIDVHRILFSTNFGYAFNNSSVQWSPSIQHYRNRLSEIPVTNLASFLSLYHKFSDQGGNLKCSLNSYVAVIGERKINNNIINVRYQRPLLRGKYIMSISLNNLTNEGQFVSYQQSAFSEQLSFFNLRGRQVIVAIRKNI